MEESENSFVEVATEYFCLQQQEGGVATKKNEELFRGLFGVSTKVCGVLWVEINQPTTKMEKKHLLWALFFLRHYCGERINAHIFQTSEKTYWKWTWLIVELILELDLVSFFFFFHLL